MMDRRKSLTMSPALDKGEDSMLPWSQCEGLRSSSVQQDPQQEEVFEDHSQGALSQCDMVRQPQLVLTDILTTKVGRDYLHKTRHSQEAQETGRGQGRGARARASQYSRETWRGGGEEEEDEPGEDWMMEEGYRDRAEPPGSSLRPGSQDPTAPGRYTQNGLKRRASLPAADPPTRPLQDRRRSCHQRASEEEEEEEEEDEEDEEVVKMVIVGEDGVNGEEQRCRPRDRGRTQVGPIRLQEPHPPQFIGAWDTDSGSDAEGNESPMLRCNSRLQSRGRGLSGSWSSRRSVLRLSGETRGPEAGAGPSEGSANPKRLRLAGQGPSNPPGIVMMITGMEEGDGASPVPGSGVRLGLGVRGRRGALRSNPSTPCIVEPIVLSSDDEELSGGVQTPQSSCSSRLQPQGELEPHRAASLQGPCPTPQRNNSWMQRNTPKLIRVSVPRFPSLPPPSSSQSDYPSSLPFTHLFWGGVWAQASADARVSAQRITIPLKGGRGPAQVLLQHPGLWRYSVWEQSDLFGQGLSWKGPPGRASSPPPTLLLLYLSNAQAVCVQRQLRNMSIKSGPASSADQPSPFLLLSLSSSMEGVEGALCRSNLDILCLGAWPYQTPCSSSHGLAQTPSLTLKESLELINSSDTDDHLLLQLCPADRPQPETQVLVLDSVQTGDEETGDEVLWSDGEKEIESEDHSQASIQVSTQASIQASTQASSQASTQASMQASSQASTQASIQASTQASTPASIQANTPASTQAEPQMKSSTELLTESHMGSQKDGLNPERDQTEAEAGPSIKEGVSPPTPVYTLCHRRVGASYSVSLSLKPDDSWSRHKHRGPARRLIQFPPPPIKGGITVATEDLECLNNGQFLNDVIIDFFLKYLILEAAPDVSSRSHVFSSFFFKQLTRRDNASEDGSSTTSRQKRHHRVKNWTRHVDIFKKDFLFVPVNQESHWYLVVICFPGLEEPQYDTWEPGEENSGKPQAEQEASGAKNIISQAPDRPMGVSVSTPSESTVQSPPSPVDCTQMTCHKHIVCKRPCILIMDSLRFSLHERVHKLLREYLQSEWEVRRGSERDFSCEQMSCSHCRVPLQDNSSDCGLYLLQYVQSFLQDPVVHFELPLRLELWFPRQQVRRKRDEIRDLILRLYRLQRDNGTLGIVGS